MARKGKSGRSLQVMSEKESWELRRYLHHLIWQMILQAAVEQARKDRKLLEGGYVPTGLTLEEVHDQVIREYLATGKPLPGPYFPMPSCDPPIASGLVYMMIAYLEVQHDIQTRMVSFDSARKRNVPLGVLEIWVERRWVLKALEKVGVCEEESE